jgi:hypothetical protein
MWVKELYPFDPFHLLVKVPSLTDGKATKRSAVALTPTFDIEPYLIDFILKAANKKNKMSQLIETSCLK